MQIFIKTLTGRKQGYTFEPTDKVAAVKNALQGEGRDHEGPDSVDFLGKQLQDDAELSSYSIKSGDTIHMVLQLRGGF